MTGHTEWSAAGRQVLELHSELDAHTVGIGGSRDGALDIAPWVGRVEELLLGEHSCVDWSDGVVLDGGGIASETSNGFGGCLGGDEGEERCGNEREDVGGMHLGQRVCLFGGYDVITALVS